LRGHKYITIEWPFAPLGLKSEQVEVVNEEGMPGEIQVRGKSVFSEYWRRPEVAADPFDSFR